MLAPPSEAAAAQFVGSYVGWEFCEIRTAGSNTSFQHSLAIGVFRLRPRARDRSLQRSAVKIWTVADRAPANERGGLNADLLPFSFPENTIAYQVRGTALWPRYEPGDVILCWDREREPGDLIGRETVAVAPRQRYLKRLGRGGRKGTFDLECFNAEPIREFGFHRPTKCSLLSARAKCARLLDR
jgi:hypothetical protein